MSGGDGVVDLNIIYLTSLIPLERQGYKGTW